MTKFRKLAKMMMVMAMIFFSLRVAKMIFLKMAKTEENS